MDQPEKEESIEFLSGGRIRQIAEYSWMVQSATVPGCAYKVEVLPGDVWMCECRGFNLSCIKYGTDCRHIKEVKKYKNKERPSKEMCSGKTLQIRR
jgi:hypothetical protein